MFGILIRERGGAFWGASVPWMTFGPHLPIPLQVSFVPEVGPSAQQNLRANVRAEIKERKGKGKGKGNRKQETSKKASEAASSGSNHDGDRRRKGKGKGKQSKVSAGKGSAKPSAEPNNSKKSKASKAGSNEQAEPRVLGCPTCRGSAKGCRICRRPGYKPRGPNKRKNSKAASQEV